MDVGLGIGGEAVTYSTPGGIRSMQRSSMNTANWMFPVSDEEFCLFGIM